MSEANSEINTSGSVQISDEVIAIVASVASMEIDGVLGMASSLSNGIAELMGKKSFSKGVKADVDGDNVKIVVTIIVKYGCKIQDVAWQVQQNVKKAVENMTSLTVTAVDVCVSGIMQENTETAEKPEN